MGIGGGRRNRETNMPYPSYAKKNMTLVHNVVSRLELDILGILLTPWNYLKQYFYDMIIL